MSFIVVLAVTSIAFRQSGSTERPVKLLIVDIAGDGLSLTNAAGGVRFDVDGDGKPEQTAWTKAGSDDSFLVWLKGVTEVRSGADLLGSAMRLPDGRRLPYPEVATMVAKGIKFDAQWRPIGFGPGGNPSLTPQDAEFANIRLWADTNHNGLAEPAELRRLGDARITGFPGSCVNTKETDPHGNRLTPRCGYDVMIDGKETWRHMWAVGLVSNGQPVR